MAKKELGGKHSEEFESYQIRVNYSFFDGDKAPRQEAGGKEDLSPKEGYRGRFGIIPSKFQEPYITYFDKAITT